MSTKYRPNPFYNGVSTFKSAFPQLQDALVEWREKRGPEDERAGDVRRTGHRRGNFTAGVLPCSNPECHEGGYQIDRLIAQMLEQGESEREGVMLCSGREIGDEVRRGPVRCPHRIHYRVVLTARGQDEPPQPRPPQPRQPNPPGGGGPSRRRNRGRGPRRKSAA
jgi:hypothetical protein